MRLFLLFIAAFAIVWLFTPPAQARDFIRQTGRAAKPIASMFILGVQEALVLPTRCWRRLTRPNAVALANIAEGTHEGTVTKKADAAISTRHLLAKVGTDIDHVNLCGAADKPLGPMPDEATAAEKLIAVQLLGVYQGSVLMVASEAIAAGADVYTAAGGKVQDEPAAAGVYWKVGRALKAAAADGDPVEVQHHAPIRLEVIAALGNANAEIGGLTISAAYDQAEVTALRDKTEELADDVRNIAAALATPGMVKVLSA